MSAIRVGQCGYQGTSESCQYCVTVRQAGTWRKRVRKGGMGCTTREGEGGGGRMSSESHPTSGMLTV